jgi:hypothetical protein
VVRILVALLDEALDDLHVLLLGLDVALFGHAVAKVEQLRDGQALAVRGIGPQREVQKRVPVP